MSIVATNRRFAGPLTALCMLTAVTSVIISSRTVQAAGYVDVTLVETFDSAGVFTATEESGIIQGDLGEWEYRAWLAGTDLWYRQPQYSSYPFFKTVSGSDSCADGDVALSSTHSFARPGETISLYGPDLVPGKIVRVNTVRFHGKTLPPEEPYVGFPWLFHDAPAVQYHDENLQWLTWATEPDCPDCPLNPVDPWSPDLKDFIWWVPWDDPVCSTKALMRRSGAGEDSAEPVNGVRTITFYYRYMIISRVEIDVTVWDDTPPSIHCNMPQTTIALGAGCQVAMPDLTALPIATDDFDDDVTITQSPAPGTTLHGEGDTIVTFTATDDAGNSAQCSMTLSTYSATNPTMICPGDQVINIGASCNHTTLPDLTHLVQTEASCGGFFSLHQFPPAGTAPIALNESQEVSVVFYDGFGGQADCTFNVTGIDLEPPTISGPEDINVNTDAGQCGAVVDYDAPTATDNCDTLSTVLTDGLVSGSLFPVGTTTVQYEATDSAGNTAAHTFNVTVTDVEGPTLSCSADIALIAPCGTNGVAVNYTAPVYSDNCPSFSASLLDGLDPGAEFPIGVTTVGFEYTDPGLNTATCSFTVTVHAAPDSDGDGVCDSIDLCPGMDDDCNSNGVADCFETSQSGLVGAYYPSSDFTGTPAVRIDPVIDFDWSEGQPASGVGEDNFTVRWTGYLRTETSGIYTFTTLTDDGVRLWIDGLLMFDDWTIHAPAINLATVPLDADTYIPIVIEYFEAEGGALAQLRWTPPGGTDETIPSSNLVPALDIDSNGNVDECDPDSDGDGIIDGADRCHGFDDNADEDGDSVPDDCDHCAHTALNIPVDAFGCPENRPMGDCNFTGIVTDDIERFTYCLDDANHFGGDVCPCYDFDQDEKIDLADYSALQRFVSGS